MKTNLKEEFKKYSSQLKRELEEKRITVEKEKIKGKKEKQVI